MFKLLKLAAYAFVGYALYQMYLGMTQEQGHGGLPGPQGQGAGRAGEAAQGSANPITGPGEGMTARTDDASGMSATHHVGRGVVS